MSQIPRSKVILIDSYHATLTQQLNAVAGPTWTTKWYAEIFLPATKFICQATSVIDPVKRSNPIRGSVSGNNYSVQEAQLRGLMNGRIMWRIEV